ncbi:MAG TPA: sensor histidine kinase [Bryobacteraceae bacterium]|nr:sensor histidine kinase [Bryobacteraceae bacterium]
MRIRQYVRLSTLTATLIADTGIAIIFATIAAAGSPGFSWHFVFGRFLRSWIYANCIGGMANLVPWAWLATWSRNSLLLWLARTSLMTVVGILGSLSAIVAFLIIGWDNAASFWPTYVANVKFAVPITIIVGSAVHVYEEMRYRLESTTLQLRTKELEHERALKLATEARLASLESRLHPHFLFNTLNSISSLIPEDPKRAERLVEQMAALLRFSLESAQRGSVPLERELQIVGDYLAIEKTRLGERLTYNLEVDDKLKGASIPPLAVQTLVENSIKHVIAPNRAGGSVEVRAARSGEMLEVTVRDSGPGFDLEDAPAGHGIDNLRSRLAALYGPAARISSPQSGQGAVVQLAIPLRTGPA